MRRLLCIVTLLIALGAAGCGGGGSSNITGPILSISEIKALVLDQLFVNGGMDDEYRDYGEFAVYIRDAATGLDVACTRPDGGIEMVTAPGVYYSGLSIRFQELTGNTTDSVARFKLVFVEKDGADCPNPISSEDDIAGESAELTFDQLLGGRIWATNGLAAAVLRSPEEPILSVPSMSPSLDDGLVIDKLYFTGGEENARYYIFAEQIENGQSVYQCQVDDSFMEKIRTGGVVYAALGFPISCFDPEDPDFVNTEVRIGLYIQRTSGPELVGQTQAAPIGDLIGERVDFNDDRGYVTFRRVTTGIYGSPVIRLGDLTATQVTKLQYDSNPSSASPIELHAIDPESGVLLACAGGSQGLVGLGAAGTYDGLSADFVSAKGQLELFGSENVVLELVERTDGDECPKVPSAEPAIIAQSASLDSEDLREWVVDFDSGGFLDFVRSGEGS